MHFVPIESRQITFVRYDEESSEMTVHYSTGEIRSYPTVSWEAYELFLNSPNRYDYLVRMTNNATPLT